MFKNTHAFSGFSVNEIEAAKKFYQDMLGLDIHEEPGMGMTLKLSGGHEVFVYPKPNHVPATYTILNFVVDNIDEAADELTKKGIMLERYEGAHQDDKGIARGLAAHQGPDIAWFTDPSGNILSILQDK